MKLGTENRNKTIAAAVLGGLALVLVIYEFASVSGSPSSSLPATPAAQSPSAISSSAAHPVARRDPAVKGGKKERPAQSLDPTLRLRDLAATEQIKYSGSGRNIFVSQAEPEIQKPIAPGQTDRQKEEARIHTPPPIPPPPPIPLKFFGFANQTGEAKKIFLSKGDDVFIAGEGEIVDRRYKVVKISPTSVEIQDLVVSGPPQSIPLTLG